VNLNQEVCKRSMQKQHERWDIFQCFVDGGGNPRERARWPDAGPFENILTSSEQVDKQSKLEVHCRNCGMCNDSVNDLIIVKYRKH
jgi:hypothetical protein